jgi:predicted TIM-barrel fold metal-dependent hydrolase
LIIDCHTHIWQSPDQLGRMDLGEVRSVARHKAAAAVPRAHVHPRRQIPAADSDYHWSQSAAVDKSIVLGFKSRYMRAEIPNRYVSDYVNKNPQKLIGFAGIDPTEPGSAQEVKIAKEDLRLRGITLSPANQDFHPSDSRAMKVYEEAERLAMPILIHPSGQYTEESKLEYARPYLMDEVARTFPKLRLIVAQLGQPWVEQTVCLLGKHPNVFADVSGLLSRPWQAYNALVTCYEAGVIDKLLFGSDFPYTNAEECIESLYRINQLAQGTNLPVVPREALRGIVERDTIHLLGLA